MTMCSSLCLKRMRRTIITEILSFLWGLNICTTEEEPHVNGHLLICLPVYHLWSLIYLNGVSYTYSLTLPSPVCDSKVVIHNIPC